MQAVLRVPESVNEAADEEDEEEKKNHIAFKTELALLTGTVFQVRHAGELNLSFSGDCLKDDGDGAGNSLGRFSLEGTSG